MKLKQNTKPHPKGELELNLGGKFREVRRSKRVWLRDLADKLGVSVNTIRWHESGSRMLRSDLLIRAANAMEVDPCVLINPDNDQVCVEQSMENDIENA